MMNLKEMGKGSKKKIMGGVLAGAIGISALGGGAYAYKADWDTKIDKGVSALAKMVYGNEINSKVDTHNEGLKKNLASFIATTISNAQSSLTKHKNDEIQRGKDNLDAKYNEDTSKAKKAVDDAIATQKANQEAETNKKVAEESGELDAIVESELNKIPK